MSFATLKNSYRCIGRVLLIALLAFIMTVSYFVPTQAFAAKDPYKYTVRLYSGAQGSFTDGTTCLIWSDKASNSQISFHQGDVKLDDDSKYYVRGWKVSGRDNDTTSELLASFTVTSDIDLVVSYGILGDNVAYTVRYVDNAGNELYPTESFYGNVGDRPMLAYRYIDGYQPQAYNLTGELLANASDNVYTFVYTPVEVPEDVVIVNPATPVATPATTTPEAPAAAAPATTPVAAADAPATLIEPTGETTIVDDANPAAGPAVVEDIRDDANPLASGVSNGGSGSTVKDGMYMNSDAPEEGALLFSAPVIIGVIVGILAVAAAILIPVLRNRKKKRAEVMQAARAAMASGSSIGGAGSTSTDPYATGAYSSYYGTDTNSNYTTGSQNQYYQNYDGQNSGGYQ